MNTENIKIDFYIRLWELYNSTNSLYAFESKVLKKLKSSKAFDAKNQEIYFSVLRDFFHAHNMNLYMTTDNLLGDFDFINTEENIFVDFLIKKLNSLGRIFEESEERHDLKVIRKDVIKEISKDLCIIEDKKMVSEIIKATIRRYLHLGERDSIFFLKEKIVIRYFTHTSEKRYEGAPSDELEQIYKEGGLDYYKHIVNNSVSEVMENELNLNTVDNIYFHKSYIKKFQAAIMKNIKSDFQYDNSILKSFTGYVFRRHFDDCLMEVAERILELSADEKNRKIASFMDFYDGSEIYINQKVIEKTSIKYNNEVWYYNSIFPLTQQREKLKKRYLEKKEDSERTQMVIDKSKESLERYNRKKAEFESDYKDLKENREYRYLLIDIKAIEEEVEKREEKLKELKSLENSVKNEFTMFEEKIILIKKALMFAISGFRI